MDDKKPDAPPAEPRNLPEPVARRGITEPQWLTLANNLYPGANPKSVLMVWDYCASRGLDPMKKPCHIVPMQVKDAKTGNYEWRDVVMPGIYEYRTTAHRTGEYLGHSEPMYGPEEQFAGVTAPEWCKITVYRLNRLSDQRIEFPVQVFFAEVVATNKEGKANARWMRAPKQMLAKCTEAAGIREAFPEEIGGEPTADELDGQAHIIDITPKPERSPALVAFDRLPEGVRDILESAFARLGFNEAQRITKLNEYLLPSDRSGQTADDGADALMKWLQAQSITKKKPEDSNGKKSTSAPQVQTAGSDRRGASESDVRPAGAEAPSQGSGHEAPATTAVVAGDLF